MMKSEILQEFVAMVEANAQSRPSLGEFEMAYQARVAIDRIRFAIKATESTKERTEQLREAGMQLLDALDRLEVAERRFQDRWRRHPDKKQRSDIPVVVPKNGTTHAMS
jgi:urease accessory protein UreF